MSIYLPDGMKNVTPQEPQQTAIVVDTTDGKRLAFPQVAVAMLAPEVVELIAQSVVRALREPAPEDAT